VLRATGEVRKCLNLGSYNYLGFGDPDSPTKPVVLQALEQFSVSTTSVRSVLGTTALHVELEKLVARFVGKEVRRQPSKAAPYPQHTPERCSPCCLQDAMVFGMGFGTNSTGLSSLISKARCCAGVRPPLMRGGDPAGWTHHQR
jgi:serine palmitoyltransferase